uniref:PPM-type phosphatase domain-containing protein n=1 Tax=Oncorhynchus tshawytscha TaxID=74940 RepID=A0A8C8FAB0_ONCTS
MESVRIVAGERSRLEVDSLSTSVGILDSEIGQIRSGSKFLKASGGALFPAGKIIATGEDDGGGGETKLLGLATTSLLHIAIRNGIYQNQAANATSSAANLNMTTGKTPNIYSLVSVSNTSVNSLLTRRRRHKRNLSAAASTTSSPPAVSSIGGVRPTLSASSVNNTLSLDRKTLLRQKQAKQLQPNDKAWVRADLQQGCIHVHDRLTPSYPRAVLCTVDTTAGEIAARLGQLGGKCGGILRMTRKTSAYIPSTSSSEVYLNDSEGADMGLSGADSCGLYSGSDMESSTFDDLSPGGPRPSQHRSSLSDAAVLGTNSSVLSPNLDSATEELDPFGSSSDEVELDPSPTHTASIPTVTHCGSNSLALPLTGRAAVERDLVVSGELRGVPGPEKASPAPALFAQLHGGAMRRLEDDEKPLQMQNEYLSNLGYGDPWRVQEEGMDPEIGCLIRFYAGKPQCVGGADRVQLTGVFNVRKGKLALPVNRWSRRHVTLSGTCFIVSSVKYAHTGKMHILPLIGGKVEEVRRHSHCLAFSSSGPQSQTYYISYDSYTEHLRWHRQAAKVLSQRVSSVDLSCCSLEELPSQLFYSQDLTHLNLKHNYLTGLTHLTRFCRLRSLNLSNNALSDFPLAVCDITSLTELNLQGNLLTSLPSALGTMHNLQTLLLDGNSLNSLPAELGSLEALTYLGLSFNLFSSVPPALERLRGVERLCLAGNQLSSLDMVGLQWLPHRHIDLRLNRLQRVVVGEAGLLSHVAQLDVRDAGLEELDVRTLSRLELLRCDRNTLTLLRVSGLALKGLHTAQNGTHTLTNMDTCYSNCPHCRECRDTYVLDISHNNIKELPIRLFCSASLRKVLVGCNSLRRLPERLEKSQLEVLDVQHNLLTELPHNLFIKAQSLRYLNASANKLECLPPASLSEEGFSSLQELYLTNNSLTDKSVPLLTGHAHLRVLHLAYNQLQTFPASKMARLEQLEELDLSGNRLRAVPTTILSCRHMHTLSAHSNNITVFPEVLQLQDMKVGQTQHTLSAHSNNITVFPECVDLSCNELCEVVLPESLPAKLQELDLTGNPRLNLDHRSLELLNNIRCFRVDPSPSSLCGSEGPGEPAVWSHGYTEASGVNNKLCVAALALDSFRGSREALYGVFDGDRNVEVPYLLQCTMGDVLAEELHKSKNQEDYMTNTFLTMQRKLGTAGQRLGGSAALCHIRHGLVAPSDRGGGGCFTVTAANVGRCQAVLCRDGKALPVSTTHTVRQQSEYQRARQHHAIITEDNKVNGVTDSTRIMGYSFLCPAVTPRPHVSTVTLTPQDEFFILASRGLWDTMSTCEAVEAVRNVPDSLAAAKKLCTLAQGYGCPDSLCAVVVQLSITEDCCCCEPPPPPPSPGLETQHTHTAGNTHHHPGYGSADGTLPLPPPAMGTGSEVSSEVSTSEMSSEVGSTASSDEPANQTEKGVALGGRGGVLGRGAGVYGGGRASFQRQYSGALSDNGLDSEDEEPIAGVFSNGSRVEVEADIHCLRARAKAQLGAGSGSSSASRTLGGTLGRKGRGNGSVACQGRSQDVIEEVGDAPVRKQGGYFNAPAQPDPDDKLVIPPELEEEIREIMKQQQEQSQTHPQGHQTHPQSPPAAEYYVTPF